MPAGRRGFPTLTVHETLLMGRPARAGRLGSRVADELGGLAAVARPDRILVFGGEAPLRIFNATEMYEPAGNRWIALAPMPTARHGIGAAVIGGRVYVPAGGSEPGFAATQLNEADTPGAVSWPARCWRWR